MSAYAQKPPPLSLEQWWKPPPETERQKGRLSAISHAQLLRRSHLKKCPTEWIAGLGAIRKKNPVFQYKNKPITWVMHV